MKIAILIGTMVVSALYFSIAQAEEQYVDSVGRVQEYRLQSGNLTYAYDAYRNPKHLAIGIVDGKGAIDFRDPSGVHLGVGGPGMLPFSVQHQMKTPLD
jgi:hypothetical protein